MERIRLTRKPLYQRLVGWTIVLPNYRLGGVRVDFEDADRMPDRPVLFAMNHTDRYNYFPFQVRLWREHDRYTATWVKGKYYESRLVGAFMELTNQLPTVSRGYLVTRDFMNVVGRRPDNAEYEALRDLVDGEDGAVARAVVPAEILDRPRDMLGRPFDPERESYAGALNGLFRRMMQRFTELNRHAIEEKGLDVLVFPQGTRSIRLSRGHTGIAQIALRFGFTIVPVGCNGSDRLYPGGSPIARPGRVVYRFGHPIGAEEMAQFRIDEPYEPFSPEAEQRYKDRFQGLVDLVMNRIDGLLDEPYRYSEDLESGGVSGVDRFV
jgi:1-acyl-sn-glycerol-3-phosphate acyltransferase